MAARKDYECSFCGLRHLDISSETEHVETCPICNLQMRTLFLSTPSIRKRTATRVERGIKKDLLEAAQLSDLADYADSSNEKWHINREVEKLKTMEVKNV